MIPSKVISALLAALTILTVACAVLMAFQLLLGALQDGGAADVLRWIGFGCLLLLIVDVLLLVGALAIRAVQQDQNSDDAT
jgi:hypothetical protein